MLLRIKYSKTPAGRFLSHLDLLRSMERAFRRAHLPLAFSEGFNPHPRISYGSALAVGVTSDGEYLDVMLREKVSPEELKKRLEEAMPPALKVLEFKEINPGGDSLTALINMARYRVRAPLLQPFEPRELEPLISRVMAKTCFYVNRQGKKGIRQVDIREGIYELRGYIEENILVLEMVVKTGSQGNVRPEEVVAMLEKEGPVSLAQGLQIHREGLFVSDGDTIKSPMEL